jgi:hypothetical protein
MPPKGPLYVPPGALMEITARVVGGRYLMAPTPELVKRMWGCLGRALWLVRVQLHAFAFLSNHWHGLLTVRNALMLSRFRQRLHSMVAVAVRDVVGWKGQVFLDASEVIVAPDAEERRLEYVLSQGAKEGLVASPREWPGLHCARALCGEETLVGEWWDRTGANRRGISTGRRTMRPEDEKDLRHFYPIELTPLPSWQHLSPEERVARAKAIVGTIEERARENHPFPLGVERVIAEDPMRLGDPPPRRRRAPVIHTGNHGVRDEFMTSRYEFRNDYGDTSWKIKSGRTTQVPANCFPPLSPFRTERVEVSTRTTEDEE